MANSPPPGSSSSQSAPSPQPAGRKDAQTTAYEAPEMASTYTRDLGLLTLPVAGPDGSRSRVIKTHAVMGYRTVKFSEVKRGTPPMFPSMQDTPSGDKLLGAALVFPLPAIGGSQDQYDYAVSGTYTYLQDCQLKDGDVSNLPNSQSQNFTPPSQSESTLYGPRGNYSVFQTGRYPFVPFFINGFISLGAGETGEEDSEVTSSPNLASVPWGYSTPGYVESGFSPLPVPTAAASSQIDLSNPDYVYWDTNIGPSFFSPSLIV